MIKVIMLQDEQGSLDGRHSVQFKKGEIYDLTEYLFKGFFKRGLCKKLKKEEEIEAEQDDSEYENKMLEEKELEKKKKEEEKKKKEEEKNFDKKLKKMNRIDLMKYAKKVCLTGTVISKDLTNKEIIKKIKEVHNV